MTFEVSVASDLVQFPAVTDGCLSTLSPIHKMERTDKPALETI